MRRRLLLFGSVATVLVLAALAAQRQNNSSAPPLLQRALKATDKAPPTAIIIEMGVKDAKPANWSGKAIVSGAKVVRRDSYRFRTDGKNDDKLVAPNAWQASSHYSVEVPKRNPFVRRIEPIATVGVILYVADVKDNATVTVQVPSIKSGPAEVDLNKVLAGKRVGIFGGYAVVRRFSSTMPVVTGGTEDDYPAASYGPDGTIWLAYTSYTLRDESRRIQQHQYKNEPKDFKHLYHPAYADQLFVKSYSGGKWGQAIPVTDNRQDIARCAIAVTDDNDVWIIYSAHRGDSFDIYGRRLSAGKGNQKLGKEVRLSANPGPDVAPTACADSKGKIWVAWQSWNSKRPARIAYCRLAGGKWTKPKTIELDAKDFGNCWHPALAAGPGGAVALAYDVYRGQYDVAVKMLAGKSNLPHEPFLVLPDDHFQTRPAITFDPQGYLWIAHEVGPMKWGKDYGAQDSKAGNPLYNTRTVAVVRMSMDGDLSVPAARLPDLDVSVPHLPFSGIKTNKYEKRNRYAYPKIGLDGKGRIWLTYRRNFGSRYTSHPGAVWRTYARRLDGDEWTPGIEIHHSDGLLDDRPSLLPHHSGGMIVIHNTDGRYTTPTTVNNQIYMSFVDLDKKEQAPKMIPRKREKQALAKSAEIVAEEKDVQRIRNYRINSAGKPLRLLRGDFHRHTEISWDGEADGSLEDMFRYSIDAVAFDWIAVTDHDNGAGREYPWWLTQKWDDAYLVAGKFTPLFSYERSVSYPHGHRNVMFAKRGVMTLPRLAAKGNKRVAGIHPDDAKMLYRYLHQLDGVCASHTSATGMGTDWRDNDPKVEPVVEIYQGDRMSYETQGAPRAGYDPKTNKFPANVGGWHPLGYVDLALRDKGYKLSFQASSDHWSTHISYFMALAEKNDRESIVDAVKKRHCYAATDNIIVDLRSGDKIQGDELTSQGAPSLQFEVIGTGNIAKIDVLKDSRVVHTFKPKGHEYKGTWTDPKADNNQHYYYIRVLQNDGEIAWASPMWIRRAAR